MAETKTPVRAKCLGCHEVASRLDYEETASAELVRIRCATCGAKRVAKVVYGEEPVPNPPAPPPVSPGPTKEEEIDLLAEARRIFEVDVPTEAEADVEATIAAVEPTGDVPIVPAEGDERTIDQAYRSWLRTEAGAVVSKAIRDRALALRQRGWEHYGIAALFEAARFDRDLDLGPEDVGEYRLNNNFRSRLARDLMTKYEDLAGFFETRELRS